MKVQLHERIGSAIETVFAENVEDLLPELAHHYSRSANRAKALEFLHRAGEQAMNGRTPMIARVYHGYMDESGTDDKSEVVAVAGYLATYEQWIAFEKEWESLMREYRVEDFHMNVFEAYQRKFADRDRWTPEVRGRFMERLTNICQRHTIIGLGCAVVREQYERELPKQMQDDLRHPYYFCMYACLNMLLNWKQDARLELIKPVNFLFDQKKGRFSLGSAMVSWEAWATELYQRVKAGLDAEGHTLGQMTFGDRRQYPQLRAADLIVFETARLRKHQFKDPDRPLRKSMEVLRRDYNLLVTFLTEVRLRNFVRIIDGAQAGLSDSEIRASLEKEDPEGELMQHS